MKKNATWDDYAGVIIYLLLLISNAGIFITGLRSSTLTYWDAVSVTSVCALTGLLIWITQKK